MASNFSTNLGAITAILSALACGPASAATLDFTQAGTTGNVAAPVILSNATLSSSVNIFIGAPSTYGDTNGLGIACGATVINCQADWTINFMLDVMNLSLSSFFWAEGDNVNIFGYFGTNLMGVQNVASNGSFDLSSFGIINSLVFEDSSSRAGIGFGDFSFDAADAPAVPIPAALPLFAAGLGAMGFMGWRRKWRTA